MKSLYLFLFFILVSSTIVSRRLKGLRTKKDKPLVEVEHKDFWDFYSNLDDLKSQGMRFDFEEFHVEEYEEGENGVHNQIFKKQDNKYPKCSGRVFSIRNNIDKASLDLMRRSPDSESFHSEPAYGLYFYTSYPCVYFRTNISPFDGLTNCINGVPDDSMAIKDTLKLEDGSEEIIYDPNKNTDFEIPFQNIVDYSYKDNGLLNRDSIKITLKDAYSGSNKRVVLTFVLPRGMKIEKVGKNSKLYQMYTLNTEFFKDWREACGYYIKAKDERFLNYLKKTLKYTKFWKFFKEMAAKAKYYPPYTKTVSDRSDYVEWFSLENVEDTRFMSIPLLFESDEFKHWAYSYGLDYFSLYRSYYGSLKPILDILPDYLTEEEEDYIKLLLNVMKEYLIKKYKFPRKCQLPEDFC